MPPYFTMFLKDYKTFEECKSAIKNAEHNWDVQVYGGKTLLYKTGDNIEHLKMYWSPDVSIQDASVQNMPDQGGQLITFDPPQKVRLYRYSNMDVRFENIKCVHVDKEGNHRIECVFKDGGKGYSIMSPTWLCIDVVL